GSGSVAARVVGTGVAGEVAGREPFAVSMPQILPGTRNRGNDPTGPSQVTGARGEHPPGTLGAPRPGRFPNTENPDDLSPDAGWLAGSGRSLRRGPAGVPRPGERTAGLRGPGERPTRVHRPQRAAGLRRPDQRPAGRHLPLTVCGLPGLPDLRGARLPRLRRL